MPLVPHTPAAEAEDHAALIVALDAGDLAGPDLERAAALPDACSGCAALRDDLAAIRGAMTALPVPQRRRDYRLSEADAARLRPTGWRRLAGWLAAPGSSVRPLATGLAALGVVGLLLTAGLPGFGAGAVLAPAEHTLDAATEIAPNAADEGGSGTRAAASAPAEPSLEAVEAPAAGMAGEASPAAEPARDGAVPGPQLYAAEDAKVGGDAGADGPAPGLILSILLLAAGLGLFIARAIAQRRTA